MGTLGTLGRKLEEATVKRQGQVLPTENGESGFHGATMVVASARGDDARVWSEMVWRGVFQAIMEEFPDASPKATREFLDSKHGTHLAEVALGISPENLNITVALRNLRSAIRTLTWVPRELGAFVADAASRASSVTEMKTLVDRIREIQAEAADQEAKKNWKEREAAMHALMAETDALLTCVRAWFAQKR